MGPAGFEIGPAAANSRCSGSLDLSECLSGQLRLPVCFALEAIEDAGVEVSDEGPVVVSNKPHWVAEADWT